MDRLNDKELSEFVKFKENMLGNIGKVIIGKSDQIEKILIAFICSGHVLLEDVPGLGKTKLAKAMATTLDCSFKRIQFTPDLLPSDLTGIYFYNQKVGEFEFRKGPILSQFVLIDEINRATPRTQSALLEAMEERQVTVEGNTVKLKTPFFVIATQNPIEQFGTFPLPEAQMDRFFIRLSMGYPDYTEEKSILDTYINREPLDELKAIISSEKINFLQENYKKIYVSDHIKEYIIDIVRATRCHPQIELGCSPRGSLNLMRASQALAAIKSRNYVIPEDVKEMTVPILSHRLMLKTSTGLELSETEKLICEILNNIKVPLEELE